MYGNLQPANVMHNVPTIAAKKFGQARIWNRSALKAGHVGKKFRRPFDPGGMGCRVLGGLDSRSGERHRDPRQQSRRANRRAISAKPSSRRLPRTARWRANAR